jgi:hypothetical protein
LFIGGLGRKHYCYKELKRGFVIEFGVKFWEKRRNISEELVVGFGGSFHIVLGRYKKSTEETI